MPLRVQRWDEALAFDPDGARSLVCGLRERDPLADALISACAEDPTLWQVWDGVLRGSRPCPGGHGPLGAWWEQLCRVPEWVDWERIQRGGRLLFTSGFWGGAVLGAKSLVHGYASPAGNKALVFTGQLQNRVSQRLAETGKFVTLVCKPGGLYRHRDGFVTAVRVRMMHAQVRHMIDRSGKWNADAWGEPINQYDMAATVLLFSQAFVEGLERFGLGPDPDLHGDFLHLWRYVGYLMGVREDLLPLGREHAECTAHLIELMEGSPDEDSRDLVRALIETPPVENEPPWAASLRIRIAYGFCAGLLGRNLSKDLGIDANSFLPVVPAIRRTVGPVHRRLSRFRLGRAILERAGQRHWERSVTRGMGGHPVRFSNW